MDQNKDKNETISANQNQITMNNGDFDPTTFFRKDKNFTFAHQKIKKLVAAVYMITNYFDQSEPLKWSLRRLGMDILRLNIDFKDKALHGAIDVENTIRERVLELVALLEVASFAGLVSPMNLSILKKEFSDLLDHIHKTVKAGERAGIQMDENFFSVLPLPELRGEIKESKPQVINNGNNPARNNPTESVDHGYKNDRYLDVSNIGEVKPSQKNVSYGFTTQKDNSSHGAEQKDKLRDFSPVAVKKNKRQSIIINLLKRKKEVMIKDISSIISDCSEKTIQRELFALVDAGILKKEGERRWTRYSLVATV